MLRSSATYLLPLALAMFSTLHAKPVKLHGFVTVVHSQNSFEIDDYRVMRDESITLDFDTDEDEENNTDHPKDIRVGVEIEIKGEFREETQELKAKSIRIFTRESKKLKRTALVNRVPQLTRRANYWEGTLRLDGQTLLVDETTQVSIVPNGNQKRALKATAKQARKTINEADVKEPEAPTTENERGLTRLDEIHPGMYASYEGARLPGGTIRVSKIQFKDNEMTRSEARMWKGLTPSVKPFRTGKPGEVKLGKAGKFKTTPSEEVQAYVNALGERLIPSNLKNLPSGDPNRIPFQFHVVEEKYVNAFAFPNGVIVVTAPMMALVENEAQLASVLGHEIAHAAQEHTARQLEFHKKKRTLLQIGAIAASAYGAYNVAEALNLTAAAIANGYQRYLENQADRIGMEYMMDAGYDPREAARMWKTMSLKLGGDAPTNFFWSNHDNNTTRRSYLMSELAVNYQGTDFTSLKRDSPEFGRMKTVLHEVYSRNKKIKVTFSPRKK